ncbi:MAG: hypothetical protein U5R31_04790 [Acidimicrobiia bacterium]|nr:hypothetical protein [Acidimicrobiia bacterium]
MLVKEVQATVLPEPTDEWAAEASEFETLDELRADLRERAERQKVVQAQMALREKTAEALGELVDDDVPQALVDSEVQNRLQDLAMRLSAQGITLEQYLEATGQDQDVILSQLREAAEPAVRVDLALRAVADAEGFEADDDDLAAEYESLAQRVERDADAVRDELERAGQLPALRSDIRKRKALEWLVERVEIVDDEGTPIDRSALAAPARRRERPGRRRRPAGDRRRWRHPDPGAADADAEAEADRGGNEQEEESE